MGIGLALAGGSLLGSIWSADKQADAAENASAAQSQAAAAGIAEQRRQFDAIRQLLQPYTEIGAGALSAQQALVGLSGADAQQQAISAIQSSPQFAALQQQGENSILANASATGGLRGGNVQGALAQFSPALLSSLIDQQYSRLGGLTSLGQNAAAGVGNAGMQTGMNVSNLLQQQGAAQAGGYLGVARANQQMASGITNAFGQFYGMGGFGSLGGGTGSYVAPASTGGNPYALPTTGVRLGGNP